MAKTSKLERKYRPKADYALLNQFRNDAWAAYHATYFSEQERTEVGKALAAQLLRLYPQNEMEILAKYGTARETSECYVSLYHPDTKRWESSAGIELGRKLLTPTGDARLSTGPRYAHTANRGLNEESTKEIKEGKYGGWDDFCADQEKRESKMVDLELEPFFGRIVEARRQHQAESRYEPQRGATWVEIAAQMPVTGAHIRRELSL
jgi:hypothetical protein